ncbi:MAG: hypothetical protein V2A79_19055 [Planctomycetota bacterium]
MTRYRMVAVVVDGVARVTASYADDGEWVRIEEVEVLATAATEYAKRDAEMLRCFRVRINVDTEMVLVVCSADLEMVLGAATQYAESITGKRTVHVGGGMGSDQLPSDKIEQAVAEIRRRKKDM